MITLYTIESAINIVASIIAYCIIATLSGCFIAYCAAQAGDYKNQRRFICLNPFEHIDILGILCLICFGLGWGRTSIVDYSRFNNPYKKLKIVLVSIVQATSYFFIVLLCFIGLIKIMSPSIIYHSLPMILTGNLSLSSLTSLYKNTSSLALVVSIVLMNICYLGLLLGTLDFLRVCLDRIIVWIKPNDHASQQTYMLFAPLLIFIMFGSYIRIGLFYLFASIGFFVAHVTPF